MKKCLLWLFLISAALAQSPITITGTITDFSNNIATSGYIQFDIVPNSQGLAYSVLPSTTIASSSRCAINLSGNPVNYVTGSGACLAWPNDLIIPSNTLYKVTIAPNNVVTRVYNNVLLKSITNPQSLASLTFYNPQNQVVGTIVNGNPLVTQSVIPSVDSVMTVGDPQHYYAAGYFRNLNGANASVTVNGGPLIPPPINFQNGTGTTASNPSGSNIQFNVTSTGSITVNGGGSLPLPANFQNGTGITVSNPSGSNVQFTLNNQITAGSCLICNLTFNAQGQLTAAANGTAGVAQVGDILRYNVNGDNTWDTVNGVMEVNGVYQTAQGGPAGFGSVCTGNIGFATGTGSSQVFPTATRRAGITYFITPGASTSTVVGMDCGQNGSNSIFPILAWYRFSALFSISSITNTRYWIGLATWNSGSSLGTNSSNILNTAKFATDTPNSNTIAFRYSATTDTTYKAVSCVAAGSCTVVDTAVTADTNPHLFEMTGNTTGTAICYFIDHLIVTSPCITTNIPPALASSDGLADIFWTGDNKNTVTTPSATFYMMQLSLK
jgi:hypothetical protein